MLYDSSAAAAGAATPVAPWIDDDGYPIGPRRPLEELQLSDGRFPPLNETTQEFAAGEPTLDAAEASWSSTTEDTGAWVPDGAQESAVSSWSHSDADEQVLSRLKRRNKQFAELWAGRPAECSTSLDADVLFCQLLTYSAGPDPNRVDRLFRQSGRFGAAWDAVLGDRDSSSEVPRTYGETIIEQAIEAYHERQAAIAAMASGSATASEPQAGDNPQLDENRVHVLVKRMREEREARRRLDAEERPPVVPPSVTTLADRLAEPQLLTRWRIEGWLPVNSRVIVAAQYKAGKTTLVGNLVRSLVDGARWLDAANVTPIDGTVAIFDTEMSNVQLDRWLAEQGIQHSDRVFVATFRGRVVSLNLFDQPIRAMWAQCLRERNVRFLVLDCLRPLLDAFGLDEQRDAGRILVAFDALCEEARLTEAAVIQHMGHAGERSRGDSRLRDWPDVEWKLVRKDENPNSRRFISAYGRDVEVGESALAYDSMLHHLTLTGGGSRKESVVEDALTAIVAVLASAIEPLSARAIEAVLKENGSGHAQKAVREALVLGVRRAAILYKTGPKGAHLHSLASGAPMSGSPAETP